LNGAMSVDPASESTLEAMRGRIVAAHRSRTPLRLRGSGSKDFFGERLAGEVLDTRGHTGILSYDPCELVITARCGTPLSEIEQTLKASDQFLPFEPPAFAADPTIGGVIAAGLSGPRRASVGAVRDYVLGANLIDARGEVLRFGGQVIKNVAGFDVSRLLCGSLGILGLISEVSLKVMPRPRVQSTRCFEMSAPAAIDQFSRWGGLPLPISATAWHAGRAYVRLSGAASALASAHATLGGEPLDDTSADAWWDGVRHHTLPFFKRDEAALWRLSLPSTAPLDLLDRGSSAASPAVFIEWGGALRWLRSDGAATDIRRAAEQVGGTAMRWHGLPEVPMFHPLASVTLGLHQRLKQHFDPHGIFNPGRLVADL
jgi:glycolate oxidase FAD binding subunit